MDKNDPNQFRLNSFEVAEMRQNEKIKVAAKMIGLSMLLIVIIMLLVMAAFKFA